MIKPENDNNVKKHLFHDNLDFETYPLPDRMDAPGQARNKGAFWEPFILTLTNRLVWGDFKCLGTKPDQ